MKKTETPKATENTAHQTALQIAEKIHEIMGSDFFTIDQMRKKMIIPGNNNTQKKFSWTEARNYITTIMKFGLAEELPAVKDCFKIRLDHEFQLNYFDKQIDFKNEEIKVFKALMQEIFDKDKVTELPAKPVKKTVKKPVKK